MGNANGKFDATTVSYLIQQRTFESKKTAAKVLTNRSAKALFLVKSGFDKKFRTKRDTSSDGLLHVRSPDTDLPSTPAPNRTSTRLQLTPYLDTPKLATPSPDKQGCEEPPNPLEAYKSVTTQPLCCMLPHEIVGLSESDLITLVVTADTHKFNLIRDTVGSDNLSKHAFIRETNTMYEFPALLHHFQDRDGILNDIFSDSELKHKFGSQGDGFTVSLAIYGSQTMRVLVSYYRQRIETLQKEIEETNTKLQKTESALHDATQSFLTADIISGASESELNGNDYNYFLGLVDNCYEVAFRSHFCKWQHADVPLLDNTTHDTLLHMFES
eukprot:scaffold128824_cov60-Attheya_sp.AAC.1